MTQKNDGGPAFPQQDPTGYGVGQLDKKLEGMSLRDWFAGQAIAQLWGDGSLMTPEDTASTAYQIADAMLAERSKP